MDLENVDNGFLLLDHVRVPRESMLSRFSQVGGQGSCGPVLPGQGTCVLHWVWVHLPKTARSQSPRETLVSHRLE